jgi:hypothetical protein
MVRFIRPEYLLLTAGSVLVVWIAHLLCGVRRAGAAPVQWTGLC